MIDNASALLLPNSACASRFAVLGNREISFTPVLASSRCTDSRFTCFETNLSKTEGFDEHVVVFELHHSTNCCH